jgi:hypothetical protein
MGSSSERNTKHQVLFRAVNEEIRKIAGKLWLDEVSTIEVFCECARAGCLARIAMPLEEYQRQRLSLARFVMVAGHDDPEADTVVGIFQGWICVENIGSAAEMARTGLLPEPIAGAPP